MNQLATLLLLLIALQGLVGFVCWLWLKGVLTGVG